MVRIGREISVWYKLHCPRRFFDISPEFLPISAALNGAVHHASEMKMFFASLRILFLVLIDWSMCSLRREPFLVVVLLYSTQGRFMAVLASLSPRCRSIFQRSMIQSDGLPLGKILDSTLIADAFEENKCNDPGSLLDDALAEDRLSPQVIAAI